MSKEKENSADVKKYNAKLIMILGLLFIAAISGAYLLNNIEKTTTQKENVSMKSIEERLTDDGWKLISVTTCPACKEQKKILNMDEIKVLECDLSQKNYEQCLEYDIEVTPTWINTKTNDSVIGYHSIEELEELVR